MSTTTTAPATRPEAIDAIYHVARRISRQTRACVRAEAHGGLLVDPVPQWERLIDRRRTDGTCGTLATAGKQLVRLAAEPCRPYVKRAVKRLCEAVRDLGEYRPEYAQGENVIEASEASEIGLSKEGMSYRTWTPTAASLARLDVLRNAVKIRLVELSSLFEDHADPLGRVLSVMQRIAGCVLEPVAAAKMERWCAGLLAGDGQQG